jgi:hypothetical protein
MLAAGVAGVPQIANAKAADQLVDTAAGWWGSGSWGRISMARWDLERLDFAD